MFSVFLSCAPALEDSLVYELYDAGTSGIVEEPGGLRAFFEHGRAEVLARFAAFAPRLRSEQSIDWEAVSRESFPPLEVGARWFLVPPWCDQPAPSARIRLVVNPGMACGTGWHPCTQLCLEALEETVHAGDTVLDVGSGSGILSEAARLLGAGAVFSCDIDADALLIARERVPVNGFIGSAEAVRGGAADVVVANISAATIEELHKEFVRVLKPAARLIVSGFEVDDQPSGFSACTLTTRNGWACLICAPSG